jgi:CubicO group peptidase (beta-lactamase class C family)
VTSAFVRACAGLLFFSFVASAGADQLDDHLRKQMRQMHLPGLAVAVVRDGRIATVRTYGFANLERRSPVTESSVFEIGSVSKQFTSALIMMLVEDGRVRLDEKISAYLPGAPEAWAGITVRHLLTHSSGIPNYLPVPGLFEETTRPGVTHEAIAKLFFDRLTLEFQPGEAWAYSNSGYLLLGNIIERVTGKTYWQNLEERIFKPLGMDASRSSQPSAAIANRAMGYEWRNGRYESRPALHENAYAAGAIASIPRDLARWMIALSERRLLDAASYTQMWTPLRVAGGAAPPFNYGFGWNIDPYHGRRVVSHSGGTPGFSSVVQLFEKDKLAVIVLTNHTDRVIDHLAIDIAGFYVPALARPRRMPRDPDPATTARLRRALEGWIGEKPEWTLFTPAMQVFLRTPTGSGLGPWLGADGALRSFAYGEEERVGDQRILRYRAKLGKASRWFSFVLEPGGRISQINWW